LGVLVVSRAAEQGVLNVKTFHKYGGVKLRRKYQNIYFRDAA